MFDSINPIMAYRTWNLQQNVDQDPALQSIYQAVLWPPRRRMEAEHRNPPPRYSGPVERRPHGSPLLLCGCGIYGWKRWQFAFHDLTPLEAVVGVVALWGDVVEHETGWRAAYAYPQFLVMLGEFSCWRRLAGRYGVKTVCVNDAMDAINVLREYELRLKGN